MRVHTVLHVAFVALVVAKPLVAQQSDAAVGGAARATGRVLGVFDEETGAPIAGADVIDLFTDGQARTEAHGMVELSHFAQRNDSAAVRIRKLGYADTSFVVMVGPTDTAPVQVNLRRAAVNLPALIANASGMAPSENPLLDEFEARRKVGFGHFIDGGELRSKVDNHSFLEYLGAHFPAMTVIHLRDNTSYLASGRGECSRPAFQCQGGSAQCPVALYIDNVPQYVPGMSIGEPPDLTNYRSEDFAAVEWYAGGATVPSRFSGTGAQCGVLLLWRRH